MSDEKKYDAEWSVATLTDALEALQDLIAELKTVLRKSKRFWMRASLTSMQS